MFQEFTVGSSARDCNKSLDHPQYNPGNLGISRQTVFIMYHYRIKYPTLPPSRLFCQKRGVRSKWRKTTTTTITTTKSQQQRDQQQNYNMCPATSYHNSTSPLRLTAVPRTKTSRRWRSSLRNLAVLGGNALAMGSHLLLKVVDNSPLQFTLKSSHNEEGRGGPGRTHLLLSLVIWPLTTHPFGHGAGGRRPGLQSHRKKTAGTKRQGNARFPLTLTVLWN